MLSTLSQVGIGGAGHAHLTTPPLQARSRHKSRLTVWDCALMSGHVSFQKRYDRVESTTSQMVSEVNTGEINVNDVGSCTHAIERVSAKEISSHRDSDLLL